MVEHLAVNQGVVGSSPTRGAFPMNDVEKYINKLKSPQKEICKKVRKIFLKAFPTCEEKMWVGVPWFGGKFYIVGLKDHVNFGVCIKGLSKKDLSLLEGGGKTMRHLKFFAVRDIDEKKIVNLLKKLPHEKTH